MSIKSIFQIVVAVVFAANVHAQSDVTKFLGVPVDGNKTEFVKKLKAKGFRKSQYKNDVLTGTFNGYDVMVYIGTNRNKVCRVMVCDASYTDERSIQIRFNKLCSQFENNENYISFSDFSIPDDENISYEMLVNKKRYEAIFYQKPKELTDTAAMREMMSSLITPKFEAAMLSCPVDSIYDRYLELSTEYVLELCRKKPVWFKISEMNGNYSIDIYYDNEYNRANGEDL